MSKINNNQPIIDGYFSGLDLAEKKLDRNRIYSIVNTALTDFETEKISVDDLSDICGKIITLCDDEFKFSQEFSTIIQGAELGYYLRKGLESEESQKIFFTTLKQLSDFSKTS